MSFQRRLRGIKNKLEGESPLFVSKIVPTAYYVTETKEKRWYYMKRGG